MKFTITDTKYERIDTKKEIEIEFPHYFRFDNGECYIDNYGDGRETHRETYGIINKCAYKDWEDRLRERLISIWMITEECDERKSIDTSYKVELHPAGEPSIVSEDMIKGKITKEEFFKNVNEKKEIMFA